MSHPFGNVCQVWLVSWPTVFWVEMLHIRHKTISQGMYVQDCPSWWFRLTRPSISRKLPLSPSSQPQWRYLQIVLHCISKQAVILTWDAEFCMPQALLHLIPCNETVLSSVSQRFVSGYCLYMITFVFQSQCCIWMENDILMQWRKSAKKALKHYAVQILPVRKIMNLPTKERRVRNIEGRWSSVSCNAFHYI